MTVRSLISDSSEISCYCSAECRAPLKVNPTLPPPLLSTPNPDSETMHRPSTTSMQATVVATSPINGGDNSNGAPQRNSYARVAGSAAAGVSELLLFHPVDTVAKRLMSNQTVSVKGQPTAEAMAALNQVRAPERERRYCSEYCDNGENSLFRVEMRYNSPPGRRHVFGWLRPPPAVAVRH